jgi:hypothetical protein
MRVPLEFRYGTIHRPHRIMYKKCILSNIKSKPDGFSHRAAILSRRRMEGVIDILPRFVICCTLVVCWLLCFDPSESLLDVPAASF